MISVLYVDDEPDLLSLGKIFLERKGEFTVETAISGEAALSLLSENRYDAVVSDYQMPGIDGIALLKMIREKDPVIPFILFTGRGREEIVIQAINNGADFYLQKGGNPAAQYFELMSKITQAVGKRQVEADLARKHEELSAAYEELAGQEEELRTQYLLLAENEQALRKSEQNLRSFTETLPGVAYQYYARPDGETGFYYVSGRIQEILGISGDITSFFEKFISHLEAEDRKRFQASYEEALSIARHWEFEGKFNRNDGRKIHLRILSEPVQREHEIVFSGVVLDITKQKQAEAVIQAEKELTLRLASTSSLQAAYEHILNETILVSEMDCGGLFRKDATMGEITLVYSTGLSDGFIERIQSFQQDSPIATSIHNQSTIHGSISGFPGIEEVVFGGEKIRSFLFIPVTQADTGVAGLFLASRTGDMIPGEILPLLENLMAESWNAILRIQSEEELKESEERFIQLSNAAREAILIHEDSVIADLNHQAANLFRYHRDDLVGKSIMTLFSPESIAAIGGNVDSISDEPAELKCIRADNTPFWADVSSHPVTHKQVKQRIVTIQDITRRKQMEEALERRIHSLTRPDSESTCISFTDLFDIDEIQHLQDLFAEITGVGSLITTPEGIPLTKPSNFCRLCRDIIRTTEKGLKNCYRSDAIIGLHNPDGPIVQPCLSGGLWDSGASITAGGRHVANWLIGQVRNDLLDREKMLAYADEIGADKNEFKKALDEVPVMSEDQFRKVSETLFLLANMLSQFAFQNLQQARVIAEYEKTRESLRRANKQLILLSSITRHDILNKIVVLLGNLELVNDQVHDPETSQYISKMEKTTRIIREQIEFTRVYQDLGSSEPQWISIEKTLPRKDIPKGIILETDNIAFEILADPMFEKVFFSLFDNSIRHGERVTHIRVSSRIIDAELTIIWEDDGIGIPENEKEEIFQKGYGKNTGFGLFISKEVLSITDITIRETGVYGSGARFEITVPADGWRGITDSTGAPDGQAQEDVTPAGQHPEG